jgi:hypothetical protein
MNIVFQHNTKVTYDRKGNYLVGICIPFLEKVPMPKLDFGMIAVEEPPSATVGPAAHNTPNA